MLRIEFELPDYRQQPPQQPHPPQEQIVSAAHAAAGIAITASAGSSILIRITTRISSPPLRTAGGPALSRRGEGEA
jgi:hypothetical protein